MRINLEFIYLCSFASYLLLHVGRYFYGSDGFYELVHTVIIANIFRVIFCSFFMSL